MRAWLRIPALTCILALAACATHMREVEEDLSLDIPQKVLEDTARIVSRSGRLPGGFSKSSEIDHKGNFGRMVNVNVEETLQLRPDGLIAVSSTMDVRAPTGTTRAEAKAVSLCGFATVLSESSSQTRSTTVVPIGIIPLTLPTTVEQKRRLRLSSLRTTSSSLCAPKAGEKFSVKTEAETQIVFKPISPNRQWTVSVESHCSVSAEPAPASALHPSLGGDYLTVTCQQTAKPGASPTRTTTLAFLRALGMYVALMEVSEWQTAKHRLEAVR